MCLFYYYYHPLWLITHFIVVLRSLWCTACNMIQSAVVNKTKYDSKWKLLWCLELWWTHNKRRTITSNFIPLTRCVKFIVQYVLNLFHWQDVSNLFNVFCIVVDAVPGLTLEYSCVIGQYRFLNVSFWHCLTAEQYCHADHFSCLCNFWSLFWFRCVVCFYLGELSCCLVGDVDVVRDARWIHPFQGSE